MANLTIKRLESTALRELSKILVADAKNRDLNKVSVTEVRITNDLSYMTVFIMPLPGEGIGSALKALEASKGYLKSKLAKKLNARKMPNLIFKYDEALDYGNHIAKIIGTLDIKPETKEED